MIDSKSEDVTLADQVEALESENRAMRRLLRAVMPTWMGATPDLAWPDGYGDEDDPWDAWEQDVFLYVPGTRHHQEEA